MKTEDSFHKPALLGEIIDLLDIAPDKNYLDATLGGGGHSFEILKKGGKVLGIDVDPEAINYTKNLFSKNFSKENFDIVRANYKNMKKIAKEYNYKAFSGVLFDLGASFHQFLTKGRGFSFNIDDPLDMRMDPDLQVTAQDLVNGLTRKELEELFFKLGEEKFAKEIATEMIKYRFRKKIESTLELATLVKDVYLRKKTRLKINPATKVFQALRIAINDELNNLREALPQTLEILEKKGRLMVLSFHGLEDRIIKDFFRLEDGKRLKILTKKPITPSIEEINLNPRCRSAKLRCAERI